MRLPRLLAAVVLPVILYSCDCEDVNLGKLEQTRELASFMPAANGYQMKLGDKVTTMHYNLSGNYPEERIPVRKTGEKATVGKGATYECIEYFTTENKELWSYAASEFPVIIMIKYTKDANPHGFNNIKDKDQVADVIEFIVSYTNKFPATVTRGMSTYDSFMPRRSFTLAKNPSNLLFKRSDITQEFLPTITLNGVQHKNVYHLYLNSPQYTDDEKYFNQYYPLEYIQGIYVKEGIGIVQAYTSEGKQVNITIK